MDFDHGSVRQVVEEDRLSSLPDELIHKILSSFDIKFVVQTCLLSSKWKLLWTSMPYLNFSNGGFHPLCKFSKFVTDVLSRRNHQTEVSSVKLLFQGSVSQVFLRKIANYAFSHKVQELTVTSSPRSHFENYPPAVLFKFQLLIRLAMIRHDVSVDTLKTPLDIPVLTTLHLGGMVLCGDLFSKCVNLKNLTLQYFSVRDVEVFDIITPRLSNLMLLDGHCSKVINLIAPQLEKLTIKNCSIEYLNSPPGLLSLCYRNHDHPPFSEDRFHSIHEVTICLYFYRPTNSYKEEDALKIIKMLQQLHSARQLTLNAEIIECISSFPDLLSPHPSALSNLISLTIIFPMRKDDQYKVNISTEAKNFLLENSPSASLIMKSHKDY